MPIFSQITTLSDRYKTLLAVGFFIILIIAFYGNTLGNGFVMDDTLVIEGNEYIHSLKYLPKVITGCTWEYTLGGCMTAHYYRPLYSLSLLLTYQISSQPWIFHLVNLILYGSVVLFLFIFSNVLTRNAVFSFFTAFVFLIHPINTEVVNWPSLISDSLHSIFILVTLIFYINWRRNAHAQNMVLVCLFYFFAMLAKEPAVLIVPPLILILDTLVFRIPLKKLLSRSTWQYYALLGLPFALYIVMRGAVIGLGGGITERGISILGFTLLEKVQILFTLPIYSLKTLLAFPAPALLFHNFPIDDTPWLLISICACVLMGALLFLLIRMRKNIPAFAIAWFLISLAPMAVFFYVAGHNVFAERFLFGATMGFSMLVAYTLAYLWQTKRVLNATMRKKYPLLLPISYFENKSRRRYIVVLVLMVMMAVSWSTVLSENRIWQSTATLLRANIARTPTAFHLQEYLADELRNTGDTEGARKEYEDILARNPDYAYIDHIYGNLADYYSSVAGDADKATEFYYKAMEAAAGKNYKPYNNAGIFFMQRGNYLEAAGALCVAVLMGGEAPEPQANIQYFISLLDGLDEKSIGKIAQDIQENDIFQRGKDGIVEYRDSTCDTDWCTISFSTHFNQQDVVLPFFIFASQQDTAARAVNSSFDPQTEIVSLQVPAQFEKAGTIFLFPTCQRTYYDTTNE